MRNLLLAGMLLAALPALSQTTVEGNATASKKRNDEAMPPIGTEVAAPFKGANIILLHVPDSAAIALKNFGRLLVTSGYSVDKLDLQLGYLTTLEPSAGVGRASYDYRVVAEPEAYGTMLRITGQYSLITGFMSVISGSVLCGPGKGKPETGFASIEKIALAYRSGHLGYAHDGNQGKRKSLMGR